MKELLGKMREYLDYIEEHYDNVQKAWAEIQAKCKDMRFVHDDFVWSQIDAEVKKHDLSKLSIMEFTRFRSKFYPTATESKTDNEGHFEDGQFELAWEHHKKHNPHHWQNWTSAKEKTPYDAEINCVHMVVDWLAMSYKMGGSPLQYYCQHPEITLPEWAVDFVHKIFDRLEKQTG